MFFSSPFVRLVGGQSLRRPLHIIPRLHLISVHHARSVLRNLSFDQQLFGAGSFDLGLVCDFLLCWGALLVLPLVPKFSAHRTNVMVRSCLNI